METYSLINKLLRFLLLLFHNLQLFFNSFFTNFFRHFCCSCTGCCCSFLKVKISKHRIINSKNFFSRRGSGRVDRRFPSVYLSIRGNITKNSPIFLAQILQTIHTFSFEKATPFECKIWLRVTCCVKTSKTSSTCWRFGENPRKIRRKKPLAFALLPAILDWWVLHIWDFRFPLFTAATLKKSKWRKSFTWNFFPFSQNLAKDLVLICKNCHLIGSTR